MFRCIPCVVVQWYRVLGWKSPCSVPGHVFQGEGFSSTNPQEPAFVAVAAGVEFAPVRAVCKWVVSKLGISPAGMVIYAEIKPHHIKGLRSTMGERAPANWVNTPQITSSSQI